MAPRFAALRWAADDPRLLARFWGSMLDRDPVDDVEAAGVLLPGDDTQVSLAFAPARPGEAGTNTLHLHLTSESLEDQEQQVAAALRLGGRRLDVGQRAEEGHVVVADPEGNAFCVIEPGNSFLAGCGQLGEVACDGTRDVGLFWAAALDWPLVWDQDEETAIQSPAGGTKIAWGGPPVEVVDGRSRHPLVLAAEGEGGIATEVERLLSLGARRIETEADGTVVLQDPDGNEFFVQRESGAPHATSVLGDA